MKFQVLLTTVATLTHLADGYDRLCVTFWKGANFDVERWDVRVPWNGNGFSADDPNIYDGHGWDGGRFNDDIESLHVQPGCEVKIYEHTDYHGKNWRIWNGWRNSLWTLNFANTLSSYRCKCDVWGGSCPNGWLMATHTRTQNNHCAGCHNGWVLDPISKSCVKKACERIKITQITPLASSAAKTPLSANNQRMEHIANNCDSATPRAFSWDVQREVKQKTSSSYSLNSGWENSFSRTVSHSATVEVGASIKMIDVGASYTFSTEQTNSNTLSGGRASSWSKEQEMGWTITTPVTGTTPAYHHALRGHVPGLPSADDVPSDRPMPGWGRQLP